MKAIDNVYRFWKDLPPWAKGVAAVGTIFGVYAAVKWTSKKLKKDDQKSVTNAARNEVAALARKGVNVSFSDAQFESFSETLRDAFDGWGTSEDNIFSVFNSLKNDADVYKLISVYGTRGYYGTLENFFGGDVNRTLPAALASELDTTELKTLNAILAKKGIAFRFS